ncbi:MAG: NUDIX hydrolase [Nanoarchaeota archaeon]|nr:NUDIX hydrolase [Nanoarchaeota archaeon]MBU1269955.1 NUDIX hydrolase [Nanoarchaeota archaeon]MBU1604046.1 NUDIX hydrolase [Nanoarchaeota archaeon]MBU2442543.1 NUDIX hydrolase [Nanoarchaeota archaeon]
MVKNQHISLAVDIVVFTVMNGFLKVLLIRRGVEPFKGKYALPGGFVRDDESLEEAALRELSEETNVKNIFIKKLSAYGDVNRDPRGRIVSVVFIALIDSERFKLKASTDAMHAEWVNINAMKSLAFDHNTILNDSLDELKLDVQTTNIAAQMLPDKFTLSELQKLYETILGSELDKRNFRKRIKTFNILKPFNESKMEGAHRPAQLFSFREKKFSSLKDRVSILL